MLVRVGWGAFEQGWVKAVRKTEGYEGRERERQRQRERCDKKAIKGSIESLGERKDYIMQG